MRSPRWARFRRSLIDAAGWRCEKCGRVARFEIHHPVEINTAKDEAERLRLIYDPENCKVWCRACHLDHHRPDDPPEVAAFERILVELT